MTRLHASSDKAIDAWTGGDVAHCSTWLGDDICLMPSGHDGDCKGVSSALPGEPMQSESGGRHA